MWGSCSSCSSHRLTRPCVVLSVLLFVVASVPLIRFVIDKHSSHSGTASITPSRAGVIMAKLVRVDFEVFGRVQGVFFRKYTQSEAKRIGVRGWIRNTSNHTVQGQLEGDVDKVKLLKSWLQTTGSPSSRIDRAQFKNEMDIQDYSFTTFSIKH